MAELKTKANNASVAEFIASIEGGEKRENCKALRAMMSKITGKRAKMWGDSIIGFGSYHYKYASGREGDYFLTGFSPRKANISIYIMPGFKQYKKQLTVLGKHKHSVSCLYVRSLKDIDVEVLTEIVKDSVSRMSRMYVGE